MNRFLPSHRYFTSTLCCILVSLTFLAPAVQAGGNSKTVKERDYKQYHDEIVSVDQTNHTVTVATMVKEVPIGKPDPNAKPKPDQQQKVTTYKVTSFSVIEVNGQTSNLAALSQGMTVDVTKGMDEDVASRIVVKQ